MFHVKFLLRLSFLMAVIVLVVYGLHLFLIFRFIRAERQDLQSLWERTYNYDSNYVCSSQLNFGSVFSICKESKFWPLESTDDRSNGECLVYSFSMSYDLSFERDAALTGCQVYSFDPSQSFPVMQVSVGKSVYYRLGLVQESADISDRTELKTLVDIIKRFAHEGMTIDVVKLSITRHSLKETYEEEILEHILISGLFQCIRQLILEIHIPSQYREYYNKANNIFRLLYALHQNGYKKFKITQFSNSPSISSNILKLKQVVYSWKVSYVNELVLQSCKAV